MDYADEKQKFEDEVDANGIVWKFLKTSLIVDFLKNNFFFRFLKGVKVFISPQAVMTVIGTEMVIIWNENNF